jgi:hypothetical protein
MLYREPRKHILLFRDFALAVAASIEGARRRRAELDLMTMSPYLKRDLGLHDRDLRGLM